MSKENKELNITVVEEMAQNEASDVDIDLLKEMAEKGIMYGHKKNRTHPKFKQFIFTTRNGMEIIDLAKTVKAVENTADFINKIISEKKTILLVGTQPSSWQAVKKMSDQLGFPMIKNRWIGGLITNYKIISQRLEFFRKGTKDMEKGEFEKYTKKERVMISKKLAKLKIMFEGLDNFNKIPDAIFVVDTIVKDHDTALKEAKIAKIPAIAIIDSDDNPELVDFPIPANDHSKMSIEWIVDKILSLIKAAPQSPNEA